MSISSYQIDKIVNYSERSALNSKVIQIDDQIEQLKIKFDSILKDINNKNDEAKVENVVKNVESYVQIEDLNALIKDIECNLNELSFQFSSTPREIKGIKDELTELRNEIKLLKNSNETSLSSSQSITIADTDIKDVQTRTLTSIPKITIQKAAVKK